MILEAHPYAAIWPKFAGINFAALKQDIATHGQRIAIVLYGGRILDGRARYDACIELGIEPLTEVATAGSDDEALNLVVSLNDHRRHLSKVERAFAASRLATFHGAGRPKKIIPANEGISQGRSVIAAAKIMKVSRGAVDRARTILTHAPELEPEVTSKRIKLAPAAEKAIALGKERGTTSRRGRPSKGSKTAKSVNPHRVAQNSPAVMETWKRKLTRQMVDPEFIGDDIAFAEKYGHVWLETAEERATNRFREWSRQLAFFAKHQRQYPAADVDLNWLRSPRQSDVERFEQACNDLRFILENWKAMLDIAKARLSSPAKQFAGADP